MERKLKERLVGAAVLVIVGVLVIPLLLDGPEHTSPVSVGLDLPATTGNQTRSTTIVFGTDAKPRTTPSSGTISRPARQVTDNSTATHPEPTPTSANEHAIEADPKPVAVAPAVVQAVPAEVTASEPARTQTKPAQKSTAATQPAAPKDGWSVQIGAFGNKQNVVSLRKNLEAAGFDTFVVPLERSGRILEAVRVGPVNTVEQAREIAALLKKDGHAAAVVRNDL